MVFIRHVKVLTLMELREAQGSTAPLPSSRNIPAAQRGGSSAASDIDTSSSAVFSSAPFGHSLIQFSFGEAAATKKKNGDRGGHGTADESVTACLPAAHWPDLLFSRSEMGVFFFAPTGPNWTD